MVQVEPNVPGTWGMCGSQLSEVRKGTGRQTLYHRVSLSQCAATYGIEALELCWAFSV